MILDIHGKKIVFGMQWRTLTGSSTPSALAAGIAREVRAARIWHEDNALHMGYLSPADAQAKVKDRLYSAAAAISRVPELVPNALFAFRLEPPGAPPLYLVCGIVKGRPRVGFDQVLHDEATLATVVRDFATRCDGDFKLLGNMPELLPLMPQDRRITHVPYTLDMFVTAAGPAAVLKRPSATTQRKRMMILTLAGVLAALGWKYGKAEYEAHQRRLHPPPPQKSPAERYAEDIAQRGTAPIALAAKAMPAWGRWFINEVPLHVGGWKLGSVSCAGVATPATRCKLTYTLPPAMRGATNQTFLEAMMDWFAEPKFASGDTAVEVTAQVKLGVASRLSDVLELLPRAMALRSDFGSRLQTLRPAAGTAVLSELGVFGTLPPEGVAVIAHPVLSAPWEVSGPMRNISEFRSFPPSATVDVIEAAVDLDATPDLKQSKFMLTVKGTAYARD